MDKKQERKVIHLQIGDDHYYYGSIASMFEDFTDDVLGFSHYKVKNNLGRLGVMQNERCVIRQGVLRAKAGNRGVKPRPDGLKSDLTETYNS